MKEPNKITGISSSNLDFSEYILTVYYSDDKGKERKQNFKFSVGKDGLLNVDFEDCMSRSFGPHQLRLMSEKIIENKE